MFTDPVTLTYNTVSKSLPRIDSGEDGSEYRLVETNGTAYNLRMAHTFGTGKGNTRNRVLARLSRDAPVADPIVPTNIIVASMSAQLVLDFPIFGYTPTDASYLGDALRSFLTQANMLRLASGET